MKTALKLIFITLPLMAIGVGILVTIIANTPAPAQTTVAERPVAVRVITAKTSALPPQITGYGLVRPARVYEAISQVAGTADYVNPDLENGEILPEGAVLVRLSQADFKLAIAQAKANIRAAEARLAELDISEKNQRAALEIEQKALELKTREFERIQTLAASGTASGTALDNVEAAMLAQSQKVLNLENALALLPTQRQVQEEQIAVYQTSLQTAELNLERTTLTLPFNARVAQRQVEIGQFVRAGQITAILDGVDAAEVEAEVSIGDMMALLRAASPEGGDAPGIGTSAMTGFLRQLALTAEVRLRLDNQVLTWPAEVERISDTIDQKSGTLGVILRVDTAYSGAAPGERPPLTKGMFVEAALSAAPQTGILIPRSALHNGQVYVADENARLQRVSVTLALVQGDVALISDGLEPGAQVIVSSPTPVMDGLLLIVTPDMALEDHLTGLGQAQ